MTSSTSIMVELTPHEQLTSAQKQATGVIVKLTSEMSKKTVSYTHLTLPTSDLV